MKEFLLLVLIGLTFGQPAIKGRFCNNVCMTQNPKSPSMTNICAICKDRNLKKRFLDEETGPKIRIKARSFNKAKMEHPRMRSRAGKNVGEMEKNMVWDDMGSKMRWNALIKFVCWKRIINCNGFTEIAIGERPDQ